MAFAIDTYTGNGSLTTFSVTFPYIEQAHVVVTVDGVTKTLTTDYTFATYSTITFGTAPTAGQIIKFTRSSNRNTRLTDYLDGSTLTEATLDQDANQTFIMAQEAIDITENYELDSGQRLTHYQKARLKLKSGSPLQTSAIKVTYRHFS